LYTERRTAKKKNRAEPTRGPLVARSLSQITRRWVRVQEKKSGKPFQGKDNAGREKTVRIVKRFPSNLTPSGARGKHTEDKGVGETGGD